MGNFKMQSDKPFLPCWEDAKKRIYYKAAPEHKSHKALTGRDTSTKITIANAIMIAERDFVLNSSTQKLHAKVHARIKEYLRLEQSKSEQKAIEAKSQQ
jgi:hypothetical protein